MDFVIARCAALLALLAPLGCGPDVGPAGDWIPVDEISGILAPDFAAAATGKAVPLAARTQLRVVTYNVHSGADPERMGEVLLADPDLASADVYLLQEEESYPEEGSSRASRLAAVLDMSYVFAPATTEKDGTHGLAILSAFPIENAEEMVLPHYQSPVTNRPRIAVAADIRVGDRALHVINVHLDTVQNVTDRILQLRPAVINAPDVVLVGGDFNTNSFLWAAGSVPIAPANSVLDTSQGPVLDDYMRHLSFDTPTASLGSTESALGLDFRLDAIYTRGLTVHPGEVVRRIGLSDHWPMWVDVDLP